MSCCVLGMSQETGTKIKNPEKRKIVNKALKAVKDKQCLETFSNLMKQFIEDLLNDPDTSKFGKYFQQNYAQRPEKWAYCYRKGLGINTNMYFWSPFIKKLSTIILMENMSRD
ncbi:uncharacterized protein TNIN_73791 [Trichonephila inaurata madagascariensis]|uniref:Uncharacterized protein n=1 Tax=Trichonephila inaurata madagascariensis TaxID=2747483 RepID=A0A8X6YKX0_9ARAC|nr:uncharacterized protein TNIN_73791 [Trichonephila inaurata madagascariensis]